MRYPAHILNWEEAMSDTTDGPTGPRTAVRQPPRVLVLSDDQRFVRLTRELLGEVGAEICTQPEGCGPVAFAARLRPDLVILDIGVEHPRLGWAILEGLREHPATLGMPILVCAPARWLLEERVDLLPGDQLRTWCEPFDLGELLSAVEMTTATSPPRFG